MQIAPSRFAPWIDADDASSTTNNPSCHTNVVHSVYKRAAQREHLSLQTDSKNVTHEIWLAIETGYLLQSHNVLSIALWRLTIQSKNPYPRFGNDFSQQIALFTSHALSHRRNLHQTFPRLPQDTLLYVGVVGQITKSFATNGRGGAPNKSEEWEAVDVSLKQQSLLLHADQQTAAPFMSGSRRDRMPSTIADSTHTKSPLHS